MDRENQHWCWLLDSVHEVYDNAQLWRFHRAKEMW